MKKTILLLCMTFSIYFSYAQQQTEYDFGGTIASKYQISMQLNFKGNKVSGTYQYDKYGKDIEITGTIDAKKNIKLDEFDVVTGKQTGKFVGVVTKKRNEAGDYYFQVIKGFFTNMKTKKKSSFYVEEAQD